MNASAHVSQNCFHRHCGSAVLMRKRIGQATHVGLHLLTLTFLQNLYDLAPCMRYKINTFCLDRDVVIIIVAAVVMTSVSVVVCSDEFCFFCGLLRFRFI